MRKDESSSEVTCQNPFRTYGFVKTFAPCQSGGNVFNGWERVMLALNGTVQVLGVQTDA